jgi:hypothetical protein
MVQQFDLIGEDGRRVHHDVSLSFARDEAARIGAVSGERFTITPPPDDAGAEPGGLVDGNVRQVTARINQAETDAELDAFERAEGAQESPRETVLAAVAKRRAHLADQ